MRAGSLLLSATLMAAGAVAAQERGAVEEVVVTAQSPAPLTVEAMAVPEAQRPALVPQIKVARPSLQLPAPVKPVARAPKLAAPAAESAAVTAQRRGGD